MIPLIKWPHLRKAVMLAASFFVVSPFRATAQECATDQNSERCGTTERARQRAFYNAAPIESFAERKTQVVRAFFVDGYNHDVGLITFLRAAGEEPRVEIGLLAAIVPVGAWDRLVSDGRYFDRLLRVEASESTSPALCLYPWSVVVEAIDGEGRVRRRSQSTCHGELAAQYAFRLADVAASAIPACALLDLGFGRDNVTRLNYCKLLAGDRAAAAQAFNVFHSPWFQQPTGPDFTRALSYIFHDKADMGWPGQEKVQGSEPAARIWTTFAGEHPFLPTRVIGETADRVRMEGFLYLHRDAPVQAAQRVPATMIWTRENGFDFRVRRFSADK